MANSNFLWWHNLGVSRKLSLISAGFIVVMAAIVAFNVVSVGAQRLGGTVVDLAGRQRMLVQKHLKEVLLVSQGVKADPKATLKQFEDTLDTLVRGGATLVDPMTGRTVTVPSTNIAGLDAAAVRQHDLAARLRAETEAYQGLPAAAPARAEILLRVMALDDELVKQAGEMVQAFAANGEAGTDRMIGWEMAVAVAAALLGLFTSVMVARWVGHPLAASAEMAQHIAAGELKLEPLPVSSRDEIGRLASAFNEMLVSLRGMAGQNTDVIQNLNSAAAQILATAQQQASSTREQAAAVQEITSTVEEISQSSAQVSERAKEVASNARSMQAAGQAGLEAVSGTTRAMQGIREQAESVAENVVALSENTQAIGEIIATVNDIAEQSNLVALNAAIEAAGAGEEGRRFAVVANEIKNLADQAKEATRQVRSILEEIQKGINTSVMLTEEAVKRVASGAETTEVAETTIRRMADTIQGECRGLPADRRRHQPAADRAGAGDPGAA